MRGRSIGLVALLAAAPAAAADLELRPPETRLEIELGPRERPAKVRIFWTCFASDLGTAARTWLHARAAAPDCSAWAPLLDPGSSALQTELDDAARGRVLGDSRKGDARTLDAAPGRAKQITANFCYTDSDVEWIGTWTRRQLAALCD
jgi:hypothetical protein